VLAAAHDRAIGELGFGGWGIGFWGGVLRGGSRGAGLGFGFVFRFLGFAALGTGAAFNYSFVLLVGDLFDPFTRLGREIGSRETIGGSARSGETSGSFFLDLRSNTSSGSIIIALLRFLR